MSCKDCKSMREALEEIRDKHTQGEKARQLQTIASKALSEESKCEWCRDSKDGRCYNCFPKEVITMSNTRLEMSLFAIGLTVIAAAFLLALAYTVSANENGFYLCHCVEDECETLAYRTRFPNLPPHHHQFVIRHLNAHPDDYIGQCEEETPTPTATPTATPDHTPSPEPSVSPSPEPDTPWTPGDEQDCCPGPDPVDAVVTTEGDVKTGIEPVKEDLTEELEVFPATGYPVVPTIVAVLLSISAMMLGIAWARRV